MNRPKIFGSLFVFSCLVTGILGASQSGLTLDATNQPSPPARGRGPFPGSTSPGHSAGLPIQLELAVPNGELRPDGSMLIDFVITNVGAEPIDLPSSAIPNIDQSTSVLTLWLTSDAISDQFATDQQTGRLFKIEIVGTSAELYSRNDHPQTFKTVAPTKSILVHASSRVPMNPGTHSITAHAELLRISNGTSQLVGTADSEALTKTLSKSNPSRR
jgi:hypothetical protein